MVICFRLCFHFDIQNLMKSFYKTFLIKCSIIINKLFRRNYRFFNYWLFVFINWLFVCFRASHKC